MKKIFFSFITILFISIPSFTQSAEKDSCRAEFEWKVNDQIMMFAPGYAINFYDVSAGDVVSWFWDFGDGSYSEEKNPLHLFTYLDNNISPDGTSSSGYFVPKVCLTIITSDGCKSDVCKTLAQYSDSIIYPEPGCFVYFYPYFNDTLVSIPEITLYSFKVSAPDNAISYSWDFGDGSTSSEPYPVHGFDFMNGQLSYEVCLTVATSDNCTTSYCSPVYSNYYDTTFIPDCQAYFYYDVMESYPEQYAFHDVSAGNTIEWYWDFGDGSYSNEPNPVHIFNNSNDSADSSGYMGPPLAMYYQVCLTTISDDNCKSNYCENVYISGIMDTLFPQPCPYFVSVSTSNILGGNSCNGTASASLVDVEGNQIEAGEIFWSTGESGSSTSGLCLNVPYYVSITGLEGCQVVGSFAILDYTKPYDPFGYWTINGFGTSYDLSYALPDSNYVCNWVFSDGTIMTGDNIRYDFSEDLDKSVTLVVLDGSGNRVYTEEIALNKTTAVKDKKAINISLYPNPASEEINLQFNKPASEDFRVEIYNSLGQMQLTNQFTDHSGASRVSVNISELGKGIYFARISEKGNSPVTLRFIK
jgi:hypothetical protein